MMEGECKTAAAATTYPVQPTACLKTCSKGFSGTIPSLRRRGGGKGHKSEGGRDGGQDQLHRAGSLNSAYAVLLCEKRRPGSHGEKEWSPYICLTQLRRMPMVSISIDTLSLS